MATPLLLAYPPTPDTQRIANGRPVFGADVGTIAAALNHIAGYQLRNVAQVFVEGRADTLQTYNGNDAAPPSPTGVSHDINIFFPPTTYARHIWLSLWYVAENEGTTEPDIVASLQDLTGATKHDIGIEWKRSDGTLPTSNGRDILHVTSTERMDDGAATGGSPTGPRLLYVPSAARGADAQIVINVTEARVVQVTAAEFVEVSL